MTEEEKAARLAALRAEQARRQQAQAAPAAAPAVAPTPAPQRADIGAVVSALAADGGVNTDQKRLFDIAIESQDRAREAEERARRDAERRAEEAQSEGVADIALGLALDPESNPNNRAAFLNDPALQGMSPNDRLNALIRTDEILSGPLADVVEPEIEPDLLSRQAADAYRAREDARIQNSMQARLLEDARNYQGDPVNTLIRELNIGRDGETRDDFDRLELERRIEKLSTDLGIPPERVAVAMHREFVRDPDTDWVPFFDLTRNTNENRFPDDRVRSFIETNLSEEAVQAYYNQVQGNQANQQRLGNLQSELRELRVTAERYRQIGQPVPDELRTAISDRQARIRTFGQTPDEPEPEPERDPNPNDEVSEDRIREAVIYGNNYFKDAGIMPHIIHMRQNPDQRAATLERIQAHLQSDQNLTADQRNILWAVANQ